MFSVKRSYPYPRYAAHLLKYSSLYISMHVTMTPVPLYGPTAIVEDESEL